MSTEPMLMMQTAAGQPSGTAAALFQFFPLLLIFVIFYFLMIRPQQRRVKEHQATIAGVKKGDDVITGGGIRGRVTKVMDEDVEVEIGPNNRVRIVKATLSHVVTAAKKPAND